MGILLEVVAVPHVVHATTIRSYKGHCGWGIVFFALFVCAVDSKFDEVLYTDVHGAPDLEASEIAGSIEVTVGGVK